MIFISKLTFIHFFCLFFLFFFFSTGHFLCIILLYLLTHKYKMIYCGQNIERKAFCFSLASSTKKKKNWTWICANGKQTCNVHRTGQLKSTTLRECLFICVFVHAYFITHTCNMKANNFFFCTNLYAHIYKRHKLVCLSQSVHIYHCIPMYFFTSIC